MASIYKRKNGTYCIRVSNGMKDGKQELISATYKPPTDITPVAEAKEVKSLPTCLKPQFVMKFMSRV